MTEKTYETYYVSRSSKVDTEEGETPRTLVEAQLDAQRSQDQYPNWRYSVWQEVGYTTAGPPRSAYVVSTPVA